MTRARVLAVMMLGACGHIHRDWNAPGHVDVTKPPADLAAEKPEVPGDPGERMVSLSFGPFAGEGVAVDEEADTHGNVGFELSLHRGERDRTHDRSHTHHDSFNVFDLEGLNLGWSLDWREAYIESGPIYLEWQQSILFAAGWAFDPDDLTHGLQVTLSLSVLYLRAGYMFGDGLRVHGGILLRFPSTWVWSR